ncbi:MAG: hypothetical protein JWO36_680 [Myxococcales bacterium]|nr:hypothetical protein [Myxococcales bacterium]
MMRVNQIVLAASVLAGCGGASPQSMDGPDAGMAAGDGSAATDATTSAHCVDIDDSAAVVVGNATTADDYAFVVTVKSASATSWSTGGNEALVLAVFGAQSLIGHLVIHQGQAKFDYGMHVGALAAGEPISMKVSTLSAQNATRKATVCDPTLTPSAMLGAAAEGLINAPEYRWPIQKSFNDIPIVVGWSKARKAYQSVFSNEDGGTAEQCGGGSSGMQAEIARWGRSVDIEDSYDYGAAPQWERCTGRVPVTTTAIRMEGTHPILYYGDGHNRVFESRAGYGQTCGTGSPEKPDGDLVGWNIQNPGNELAKDTGHVIILRPIPVDLDSLGYAQFGGRREAVVDRYAPWLYRLTSLELAREGKIDNSKTFPMSRYLYVDVRVSDVNGSGDQYCAPLGVSGGFKLRAVTGNGTAISSPQITGAYAGNGNHDWKRVAIALPAGVGAADIDHFTFDAYDGDGIYLTAIGDAFIPIATGTNSATIDYVRMGTKALAYYVDDNSNSCTSGINTAGPGGTPYPCVGGQIDVAK